MRQIERLFAGFFLAFVLLSCNNPGENTGESVPDHVSQMESVEIFGQSDIMQADTLILTRDQTFMDSDEEIFGNPGIIAVDNFGRLYIGDGQQFKIHIFHSDGSYLGGIGREGDGPGEFRWMGDLFIRGDYLYANDPNGRRINVFRFSRDEGPERALPEFSHVISLTGNEWEQFPEPGFMNPGLHFITNDGSVILSSRSNILRYREDPDFEGVMRFYKAGSDARTISESFFEMSLPPHMVTEWFTIPPVFAVRDISGFFPDGRIVSANTEEFLIRIHNSEGEFEHAFYYPFSRRALTRDEALETVEAEGQEQLQEAVRQMDLPETWPALSNNLFVDDDLRIWLPAIEEDLDRFQWWITDDRGNLIARFSLPRSRSVRAVRNNRMYTVETDEETGLSHVIRYQMEFREN